MELGRRDPEGYFVLLASPEARELVPQGCLVEEAGDVIVIRTKSRSLANKLLRTLKRKGLLREPE